MAESVFCIYQGRVNGGAAGRTGRMLTQDQNDAQGATGKDLYYNLAETLSYVVTIESLEADNISYFDKMTDRGPVKADQEWLVKATLRQVV